MNRNRFTGWLIIGWLITLTAWLMVLTLAVGWPEVDPVSPGPTAVPTSTP